MSLDMDIVNAAMVRQYSDPKAAAAAQAANEANKKKTELNQQDFLTLMVTQLKNQDPFKPLDPSQYVGQLAQFSSVSGLSSMNTNLTNLYLDSPENSSRILPQGMVDVPAGASSVQLIVKDSSGVTVKSQPIDTTR